MANCTCIKLKTLDQRLTVVQQPVLASGDVGTVHVEYELDSYWEGYTPSGTFYTGKQPENIYEQPLVGGVCVVPWEVLQEDGVLYIGLRGVDQAKRVKTAAPVRYRIEKGSPCGTGTTSEPTPDVYQQILAVAGAAYDKAQSVEERADAGDFNPSATTISELVVAELANRGQLNSEFVQSTEEMKDPTKLYILPDMHIYGARKYEVQGEPLFTNLADPTDGNWAGGHQLTEEGQVVGAPGYAVTNILELNAVTHDVIRIRGLGAMDGFAHTLCLGEDGTTIEDAAVPAAETSTHYSYNYDADTGEVRLHVLDPLPVGGIEIYKFRTSGKLTGTAADVVITLNEPIKYAVAYEYEWYDTGKRADGQEGPAGPAGPAGAGVYIQSVETSLLPGGTNIVTFSDGTILPVQNGENGAQGRPGNDGIGVAGADGVSATHSWDGTVLTVTSASGTSSADLIGPAGPEGPQGQTGADGYTPVKGVDFWNADDKEEIEADISAEVADQLADKAQLQPEYADSLEVLEEKGDTSKLYVLPDGYIYAYMGTYAEGGTVPNFTNQIPISKDTAGNIYNGTGFKDGIKFSSSNGAETAQSGYVATGYIPIGYGSSGTATGEQVIHLSAMKMAGGDNNSRIAFYLADKTFAGVATAGNLATTPTKNNGYYTLGNDGFINMIDVTGFTANYHVNLNKDIAFFRLSAPGIDTNSILTVNEPIEYTTTEGGLVYKWANTGHAFVPADYEDRILDLEAGLAVAEENIESLKKTSSSGSNTSGEAVPEAVATGASNLVTKALSREYTGDNILRFVAFSDAHQRNTDTLITKGTVELGKAIGEIVNQINVGFIANLGDSAWAGYGDSKEVVRDQLKQFNKFTKPYFKGELELKCEGNHDDSVYSIIDNDGDGTTASISKFTPQEIHALVHSKPEDVVYDSAHFIDGYFYKDIPHLKTRVICLHTEQGTGDGAVMEGYQLKWFAETALNMSGKADWNVVTMAHRPPTYGNASLCYDATSIIEAFINKTNFSHTTNDGTQIAIDYTNKSCQYVAHFHGHTHAFSVVKMLKRKNGMANVEINAWEIGIPNACYYRSNQNKGNANEIIARYSTETTYNKADVDGQRTSFNLVTIDLDGKTVYADNYGAGIDRVINY